MAGAATASQLHIAQQTERQNRNARFGNQTPRRIPTQRMPKMNVANNTNFFPQAMESPANIEPANNERFFAEQKRAMQEQYMRTMLQAQMQNRIQQNTYSLGEAESLRNDPTADNPAFVEESIANYENEMRDIDWQNQQSQLGGIGSNITSQLKQQATEKVKKELNNQIKKQAEKYGKDAIWRIFGRGAVIDTPGETAWTWFGAGLLTSLYQVIKTVAFNGKDFLPGMLSFLEPNALPVKSSDPPLMQAQAFLIDFPWVIVLLLLLLIIFGVVQVILASIGLGIMGYANLVEFLGPLATLLPSIISIVTSAI